MMNKPIDEGISRREALQGGSAAAVAVGAGLLSTQLIQRAQAATSGDPRILLGDAATDPNENGEFARNGADVKVQSGGAVRNLTSPTFDAVTTDGLDIGSADFVDSGDFVGIGPSITLESDFSTTSTSYVAATGTRLAVLWDNITPANAQTAIASTFRVNTSSGDVRLNQFVDNEDVFEDLNVTTGTELNRVDNYIPSTTSSAVYFRYQIKTNDGNTSSVLAQATNSIIGVQV